jgi:putative endonuclease
MSASLSAKQVQGQMAEQAALAFLQARDLHLIERNVHFSVGETDLIMRDEDTLVFVEVRQRRSNAFGGAAQSIDNRKMKKCAQAARWLKIHPQFNSASCRFDAVLLTGHENDWQIQWLENAFVCQDMF